MWLMMWLMMWLPSPRWRSACALNLQLADGRKRAPVNAASRAAPRWRRRRPNWHLSQASAQKAELGLAPPGLVDHAPGLAPWPAPPTGAQPPWGKRSLHGARGAYMGQGQDEPMRPTLAAGAPAPPWRVPPRSSLGAWGPDPGVGCDLCCNPSPPAVLDTRRAGAAVVACSGATGSPVGEVRARRGGGSRFRRKDRFAPLKWRQRARQRALPPPAASWRPR